MTDAGYSLRMGPDLYMRTILSGHVKTAAENWIRILNIALFAVNHYKTIGYINEEKAKHTE